SYSRTLKKLSLQQRFNRHPKNRKKARSASRKVKTIAARLVRELERKLPDSHSYGDLLSLYRRVLKLNRNSKNKVYSLHEPQVQCISKGKEHKKYEFGNKVSILCTQTTGVIVDALAFSNEYDGHTLPDALSQYERFRGKAPENVYVDRGYKGKSNTGAANIHIPGPFSDKLNPCQQRKRRKGHKRRAAIEPIIGHLRQDHRLSKNFYRGDFGDAINVLLAAAAFNFRRMMNRYKESFAHFFLQIRAIFFLLVKPKQAF
ncbi:MAG: transposase, partial [Tannerella sp.]|nr:transposase [Tannerella sp.]